MRTLFFPHIRELKRIPAEDTAGSVREVLARGDKSSAAIAGRRAAEHYKGRDPCRKRPGQRRELYPLRAPASGKPSGCLAFSRRSQGFPRHAPRPPPGALLASLAPFAKHAVNLLKIESRPIHGRPWEYQFFMDVEGRRCYPARPSARRSPQRHQRTPRPRPLRCRFR